MIAAVGTGRRPDQRRRWRARPAASTSRSPTRAPARGSTSCSPTASTRSSDRRRRRGAVAARRRRQPGDRRRDLLAVGDGAGARRLPRQQALLPHRAERLVRDGGDRAPSRGTGVETRRRRLPRRPLRAGAQGRARRRDPGANEVSLQATVGFDADQEDLLGDRPAAARRRAGRDRRARRRRRRHAAAAGARQRDHRGDRDRRWSSSTTRSATAVRRSSRCRRVPCSAQRRRAGGDDDGRAGGPDGFFTANAVDCVNLIALAAIQAGSDDPARDQEEHGVGQCRRPAVHRVRRLRRTARRRVCSIDYSGYSGDVELSATTGDRTRAWFEAFGFDEDGATSDSTYRSRSTT